MELPTYQSRANEILDKHFCGGKAGTDLSAAIEEAVAKHHPDSVLQLALRDHSTLVAFESKAKSFLKATSGDLQKAVEKMVRYWDHRKDLFGDKAFLPLTMTGMGALTASDEEVFKSGFFVNLPEDGKGRPVVCYDRSLLERDFSGDLTRLFASAARCIQYVLSIASVTQKATETGVILLFVYQRDFEALPFDRAFCSLLYELIDCHPFKCTTRQVFMTPKTGVATLAQKSTMEEVNAMDKKTEVLCGTSKHQICGMMLERGFQLDGIPSCLGGNWGHYSNFLSWRRDRVLVEELFDASVDGGLTEEKARDVLARDSARKRKREQDVEYARRKRQKTKSLKDDLMATVKNLKTRKEKLHRQSRFLEDLVRKALTELNLRHLRAPPVAATMPPLQSSLDAAVIAGARLRRFAELQILAQRQTLLREHITRKMWNQYIRTPLEVPIVSPTVSSNGVIDELRSRVANLKGSLPF